MIVKFSLLDWRLGVRLSGVKSIHLLFVSIYFVHEVTPEQPEADPAWVFPITINKVWAAGGWVDIKIGKTPQYNMPYFDENDKYIHYQGNEILPLIERDGFVGWYQITGIRKHGSTFADYADWDDGNQYDFVLVGVEKK